MSYLKVKQLIDNEDLKQLTPINTHSVQIQYDSYYINCVDYACTIGKLNVVKYLISINCKIGEFAMENAAENGHLEVVKYLYEVNNLTEDDTDAIYYAAQNGNFEVVKYLYEVNAPVDRSLIIHIAVANGHYDICRFLLDNGSSKFIKEDLIIKMKYKHQNIAKMLIWYSGMYKLLTPELTELNKFWMKRLDSYLSDFELYDKNVLYIIHDMYDYRFEN